MFMRKKESHILMAYVLPCSFSIELELSSLSIKAFELDSILNKLKTRARICLISYQAELN